MGWGSYSLLTHRLRYSLKEEYCGLGKLQPADSQAEVLPKGGVLWDGEGFSLLTHMLRYSLKEEYCGLGKGLSGVKDASTTRCMYTWPV